jgi:hypothetical protein
MANIEKGIRRQGNRYEAIVSRKGQRHSRTFPLTTPLETIRDWRKGFRAPRPPWKQALMTKWVTPKTPSHFPVSPEGWCYLYIVQCQDRVKIGRAVNLTERLRSLQQGSPIPLTLLAVCPAHWTLETLVHTQFKDDRDEGEWFKVSTRLFAFVMHLEEGFNPLTFFWKNTDRIEAVTEAIQCQGDNKDELHTAPSTSSAQPVETSGAVLHVAQD